MRPLLAWRVGLDLRAARERVRIARALGELPRLAAALARGQLSYSKLRALTRIATPQSEAWLLDLAMTSTASELDRIAREWQADDARTELTRATRLHRHRALRVYQDDDGMVVINGRLDPEAGAALMKALDIARDVLYQQGRTAAIGDGPAGPSGDVPAGLVAEPAAYSPSFSQQQADALGLVAETALRYALDSGTPGERYQVVVHVDAVALAETDKPADARSVLENTGRIPPETSRRLACDSTRLVMVHGDDRRITEIGARTRTIPPALRRALEDRDRGCRFPGCGLRFAQGHHIRHWAHGGPTTLSNLVLLCRRHHRSVHEDGYRVEPQRDGELWFRRPDGDMIPRVPASQRVSRD